MQRQVITAETVRVARAAGQTLIAVSRGDIVTQQARDDARRCGIRLVDGSASGQQVQVPDGAHALPGHVPGVFLPPAPSMTGGVVPAAGIGAGPAGSVGAGGSVRSDSSTVPTGLADASASVRAAAPSSGQIADRMPAPSVAPAPWGQADVEALRALLGSLQAGMGVPAPVAGAAPSGTAVETTGGAAGVSSVAPSPALSQHLAEEALIAQVRGQVRAMLPAGVVVDDSCIAEAIHRVLGGAGQGGQPRQIRPGVRQASGVTHVDARAQNWGRNAGKDSVGVMEVLSPALGDAAAVGYLEWENMTVPWTFRRPEALVILEGAVTLSIEGTAFSAAAGDVFTLPAGSEVELRASGHVKCVTVACLPDTGGHQGNKA